MFFMLRMESAGGARAICNTEMYNLTPTTAPTCKFHMDTN